MHHRIAVRWSAGPAPWWPGAGWAGPAPPVVAGGGALGRVDLAADRDRLGAFPTCPWSALPNRVGWPGAATGPDVATGPVLVGYARTSTDEQDLTAQRVARPWPRSGRGTPWR